MTERKFKYRHPNNTEERIEAIYEELYSSPPTNGRKTTETLKDYVVAHLAHSKDIEWKKNNVQEAEKNSLQVALFALAFVAIVFP